MKRITRRQVQSWLAPVRACLSELRSGEVSTIRGYPVTRLNVSDEFVRTDYCMTGFRSMLVRLRPELDATPLERIERSLAAGVPLTLELIDNALHLLHSYEDALVGAPSDDVLSAVNTELLGIEFERITA